MVTQKSMLNLIHVIKANNARVTVTKLHVKNMPLVENIVALCVCKFQCKIIFLSFFCMKVCEDCKNKGVNIS